LHRKLASPKPAHNAYGALKVQATGDLIMAESEQEIFDRVGVPYLEPAQR